MLAFIVHATYIVPSLPAIKTLTAVLLLLSTSATVFSQSAPHQDRRPVKFSVFRPDPDSSWQVIGTCDGTRSAATLRCNLINIFISKASETAVEMKHASKDECEVSVTAEDPLVFNRIEEGVWQAVSPQPGILCGEVSTYTLKMEKSGIWFTLNESTVNTTRGFLGNCEMGKVEVTEYQPAYMKPPKRMCDGVSFGLNAGF